MTYKGLMSRLRMVPQILGIAFQSLRLGVYAKQDKYLKYSRDFRSVLATRDPERGFTITEEEAYTLFHSIKSTRSVEGAIAELGVYKGASAKIVCEANQGAKPLLLFDTFEGMPNEKISAADRWRLGTHRDTSLESVKSYVDSYPDVRFFPGAFPESLSAYPELSNIRYSLVHLDVDLYESTLKGLEYFFPRLNPGGKLISHNYNLKQSDGGDTPGVKQAFDEYFSDCPSIVTEIAETQCIVVKG